MIWYWLLPLIPCTAGLIYIESLTQFLEEKGWLKLGLERSELEKIMIVRSILFAIIVIFSILATGKIQLIVGMIGMVLGGMIMFYSEPIHRVFGLGGGNSFFRGDDQIKIIGLVMCILSALWMSGITQALIYAFFKTANLIPSADLIDYY